MSNRKITRRGRVNENLTAATTVRITPDEFQMIRDIAAWLGTDSANRATRWAVRYAWAHATSTTDHRACPGNSPCADATRGVTPPGRQRTSPAQVPDGQTTITHLATVEEKS